MSAAQAARELARLQALQKLLRFYEVQHGPIFGLPLVRQHVIEQMRRVAKLAQYGAPILALLLMTGAAALAHSWYPLSCCSNNDCRRVPCEDIAETSTGYLYDGVTFEKSAMKPSQDRWCHVCILESGSSKRGLCLFTLQGT